MKKTLLLFVLISFQGFSQISMGPTPVYVKDQVSYEGQNINLAADSNLYLRKNSQSGSVKNGPPVPPPPIPYFKLNIIINNAFTRQLSLAFISEATEGIDLDIDVKNMDESLPDDVSFWIENENYVIQGVNFDLSKKFPLSVKAAANTTFKFYIPEIIDFDYSQSVYLYDAFDKSYHDIKNGTYEVTVAPGTYTERFKISFTSEGLARNDDTKTNFLIAHDNNTRVLKVMNTNNEKMKSFALYDLSGRTVLSKNDPGNEQNFTFSTSGLSSGVYIAMFLTTDNVKKVQKVMISNSGK